MHKGDWVFNGCDQIGKVRSEPYELFGRWLMDVTLYDLSGQCVGRSSPAMGGPTQYEPACDVAGWRVIRRPEFPLSRFCRLDEVVKFLAV